MKVYSLLLLSIMSCATATSFAANPQSSRLDKILAEKKITVCTPGDYKPFSLKKDNSEFKGLDIDLIKAVAADLGAEITFVKSSWPTLIEDFTQKCDVGVGGISVTLERQKSVFFSTAYMVNGKAPITLCENKDKYQSIKDIDKPNVTVIENPGGSNERFARENFQQAKIVIFPDNTKIFEQIIQGEADVMISESVETIAQSRAHDRVLCAINPDKPLKYGEMGWLLPQGDTVFKAWIDQWFHLAKKTGKYDNIVTPWLSK